MPDEVSVITGGTRGIGAACARRLADGPHTLLLTYRSRADEADALAAELAAVATPVVVRRCDVADPAAVGELFAAVDGLGTLTGLSTTRAGWVGSVS